MLKEVSGLVLKKLQLYTICIFVVVIVLSQFTLMQEPGSANYEDTSEVYENSDTEISENTIGIIEDIKNSKYAEPINDVKDMIEQGNKLSKELKDGIASLKDMLDIEKNINDMAEQIK